MRFLFIVGVIAVQCSLAQTPENDAIWGVPKFHDAFNYNGSGTLGWSLQKNYLVTRGWHFGLHLSDKDWVKIYDKNPHYALKPTDSGNNHELSFGTLKLYLKKDTINPHTVTYDTGTGPFTKDYNFTGGKIHMTVAQSQLVDTDYGFYEMRFRIPQDETKTKGIQTNFWSFGADPDPGQGNATNEISYCEIDYFEIEGFGKWHTHNVHHQYFTEKHNVPEIPYQSRNITQFDAIEALGLQRSDFHYFDIDDQHTTAPDNFDTIGCAVEKNKITFYFNNRFVRSIERNHYPRVNALTVMQMEVNALVYTGFWNDKSLLKHLPNNNTVFPYTLEIDYIKFWKINCNEAVPLLLTPDNFDPSFPPNEIVLHATLGTDSGGQPNELVGSKNYTIHCMQEITLEDGFHVDKSSFFYATQSECD